MRSFGNIRHFANNVLAQGSLLIYQSYLTNLVLLCSLSCSTYVYPTKLVSINQPFIFLTINSSIIRAIEWNELH